MKDIIEALKKLDESNQTNLTESLNKELKALRDESANRRVQKNEIQEMLDAQNKKMEETTKGLEPLLKALSSATGEQLDASQIANSDVSTRLAKELEDLKSNFAKSQDDITKERLAKQQLEISNAINEQLTERGVNKNLTKDYVKLLSEQMKIAEDGVIQTSDGVRLDEFIPKYLDGRKDILTPNVSRGNLDKQEPTGVATDSNKQKSFTDFASESGVKLD